MGKVCGFWGNYNGKIDEGIEVPKASQEKSDFERELGLLHEFHGGSCKLEGAKPVETARDEQCDNAGEYRQCFYFKFFEFVLFF